MKKILSSVSVLAFLTVAAMALPSASLAQTATTTVSSSLQAHLDLIATLTAQVKALQQQLLALRQQQQTAMAQLVSTLQVGSQGNQVKVLQALLAADPNIYPEGMITGYFGPATAKAVKRFQKENDIDQVGRVGPMTLSKLNEWLNQNPIAFESTSTTSTSTANENNNGESHGRPCAIVPPGHLIAPGWLRKHMDNVPIVPPCQTLPPGIISHGEGNGDNGEGNHGTSTLPIISSITTSVGTSTAAINWNTNIPANAQVLFGLTSAYGSNTVMNTALSFSHSQTLTGLTPSTMYHFEVISTDALNRTATSSDMTFNTAALPATTTLPAITSGPTASNVASTTATVSWTTNIAANGTVFYSTTNPVDITNSSTPSVSTTTLNTSRIFNLTGLTASTTYFYVVKSVDGSSNVVTSTQQQFTTTQ